MPRLVGMWRANSSSPAISPRASVNWVMLIYFASGVCALIDEVVWVRLLKLTLGNTVYATSIVVSVFMGGLALGALIMGRFADRIAGRLRLYALLETIITISALSLPFALKFVDTFYVWFYRTYGPSHTQLLFVQVIISAAILLVPSILMGSTLPLLGRFITALEKEAGHLVGKLYALNTLGAAAGCFLAGFVLIRALGVMGSLYTAAALNLLVAFGGWLLSRFPGAAVEQKVEPAVERPDVISAKPPLGRFYLLIAAFFMSGLISIGYELLWMRSIVHLLGGFTYVFSAVLTIYLLGNVIGAGIGSRIVRRLKRPAVGFAVTLSLLGLCGIFYLPLMILWISKVLPYVNQALKAMCSLMPFPSYIIGILVQSVFLFLVPAVIMGIGFPIALQAWANYMHRVGRSTGTAYGANTIGAVVGGIATGFVLIPLLGVQISISILGLAGMWIAGVMCLLFARGSKVLSRLALLGLAVIFTVVTAKTPSHLFNTVVRMNPHFPEAQILLAVEEGVTTTVSVHKYLQDGALELCTSGEAIAGNRYGTRTDQKMLGHLCVLLNANAKKVLSVGFGSGETTACLATHRLDSVDCVEIAPEVVKVALKFFSHINLGDRLNDEINMIYMDAKNYLHLTDKSYDAIVNDSIHPRLFAENASLYTKEYFESVKERLNEDGLLVCWIPVYDMPVSVLNSIVGTMMDVFPHVTLWYPNHYHVNYFWLVGSQQQQYFSLRHIENELLKEGVRNSLSEIDVNDSMDVMAYYVCDENDLRKHLISYATNSDYHPFIEFATDSKTPVLELLRQLVVNVRSNSVYGHIDWTGFSQEQKDKWLADYQQLYMASTYLLMAYTTEDNLLQLKYSIDGLAVLPDSPGLLHSREEAEKLLFSSSVGMIVSGNLDDALALAGRILEIYPESATAWMIRSGAMQGSGNMEKALIAAQQAVELAPDSADAHLNLGFILFRVKQFDKAVTEYRESLRLKPDQQIALEMLAEALVIDEKADFYNPTEAVRLAERACELTGYENVQLLDTLASAYAAAGRLPDAIAAAEKALDLASSASQKEMAERISNRLLLFKAARTPSQQN